MQRPIREEGTFFKPDEWLKPTIDVPLIRSIHMYGASDFASHVIAQPPLQGSDVVAMRASIRKIYGIDKPQPPGSAFLT
jgi:hypothetical protein